MLQQLEMFNIDVEEIMFNLKRKKKPVVLKEEFEEAIPSLPKDEFVEFVFKNIIDDIKKNYPNGFRKKEDPELYSLILRYSKGERSESLKESLISFL